MLQHVIWRFICREQVQSVDTLTGITAHSRFCFSLVLLFCCFMSVYLSFDPETFLDALNFRLKRFLNCPRRGNLRYTTHRKNVCIFKKCIMKCNYNQLL